MKIAKLLKTKTFWVALASVVGAIGGAMTGNTTWVDAMPLIVLGLLGMTGRHALVKQAGI